LHRISYYQRSSTKLNDQGVTLTKKIRRVVTGHNENGNAVCLQDSYAENVVSRPERKGVTVTNLWKTDSAPAEYNGAEEIHCIS